MDCVGSSVLAVNRILETGSTHNSPKTASLTVSHGLQRVVRTCFRRVATSLDTILLDQLSTTRLTLGTNVFIRDLLSTI